MLLTLLSRPLVAQSFTFAQPTKSTAENLTFSQPAENTVDYGLNLLIGGQFSDLKELNAILKEDGISEVNPNSILIGGGINFIYRNHFMHFKGNAALNERREDSNGMRTKAHGFGAGINYGYKFDLGSVYLVPYAGLSRDALLIEIQDLPASHTPIRNQISNRNISKLHNEVLAASVGLRALIPNDWETMLTGIDFSYQVPLKSSWFNGDFTTTPAPKINVGGFKAGIEILLLKGN
ncbi:autotransporter domain-containing protein [Pontibacter ramchanderi]|uniref:autotransporter domain-containing protein n=1 Tax=Pontibacter ramchanderi TaxID=1179743 RepID=UPI0015D5CEAB|nr:autotransporter domain-containing protein [Pontibacter ramchanderi]